MNHANEQKGFTLIELLLAMTFISFLLLAIAMTIIQISTVYNHGLTLKDVNQTGRTLSTELEQGISQTVPFAIDGSATSRYKVQDWGGRLCLGKYSYIWNYGKDITANNPLSLNTYKDSTGNQPIRFVKVPDANAAYCADLSKLVDTNGAIELLSVGDHSLTIHNFSISSADTASDSATGQRLYSISLTVGTNDQNALVPDASACKTPGSSGADPAYCAIQQFNFTARAGNIVN